MYAVHVEALQLPAVCSQVSSFNQASYKGFWCLFSTGPSLWGYGVTRNKHRTPIIQRSQPLSWAVRCSLYRSTRQKRATHSASLTRPFVPQNELGRALTPDTPTTAPVFHPGDTGTTPGDEAWLIKFLFLITRGNSSNHVFVFETRGWSILEPMIYPLVKLIQS